MLIHSLSNAYIYYDKIFENHSLEQNNIFKHFHVCKNSFLKNFNIKYSDLFEELSEENIRLLDELSFADKCLKILVRFKTFVDFVCVHFINHLDSEVWH